MQQWFKNLDAKYFATPQQKWMLMLACVVLPFLAGYFIEGTVLDTWRENARQVAGWLTAPFILWAIFDRFLGGTWDRKSVGKIAIVIIGGIFMVPVFIIVFCTLIPLIVTGHL